MRSWNAQRDDRPWVRIEFEQDDPDGRAEAGTLEKAFRGAKGTVKIEFDGETITDPARADELLADLSGHPERAVLPLDRVGPPPRARRAGARRGGAPRPPPGVDLRRGPRDQPRPAEARAGALRAQHEGRQEPREDQGGRGESRHRDGCPAQRRGGARAAGAGSRHARASAREDRAAAEAELAEQRSMLEKARLAERLIAERDQSRERFERYSMRGRRQRADRRARGDPPVLERAAGAARGAREGPRRRTCGSARSRPSSRARSRSSFVVEQPTPRAWRPTAIAALVVILARGRASPRRTSWTCCRAACRRSAFSAFGQTSPFPARRSSPACSPCSGSGWRWSGGGSGSGPRTSGRPRTCASWRSSGGSAAGRCSSRSCRWRRSHSPTSSPCWTSRTSPAVEALVDGRGGPHRQHPPAPGAARGPRRARADRDAAGAARQVRAGHRAEVRRAGAARADRQGAPRPRAARGRRHGCGSSASTWRATPRRRRGPGSSRTRVDAEEVAGHAERAAVWTEQLATLQRRARVYDATLKALDTAERATMRTATRYLERRMVVDLERVTAGSLPARQGRRREPRRSASTPRSAATGSTSRR